MTYAEKLKDPRWQRKRLEILERDEFTCQLCGDKEITLHVHHKSYGNNPWESKNINLITYCEHCHSLVEFYKAKDFQHTIIKVFKYLTTEWYFFYALSVSRSSRFNLYVFELQKGHDLEFTGGLPNEILDAVNKELRVQKAKNKR